MKDDLISRSALMDRLKTLMKQITPIEESRDMFFHDSGVNGAITGAWLEAKNAPAVDAEPVVHGRWCSDGERVFCSVCDQEAIEQEKPYGSTRFLTPRCPYCGARLDGGEADAG